MAEITKKDVEFVPFEKLETPIDKIGWILEIPVNGWHISDSRAEKDLYLIHPDDTHMEEYGDLRGLVVDIKYKTVVARSYGYTPRVIIDELNINQDGGIKLTDEFGKVINLEKDKYSIKPGYDGVFIRIFKHRGEIYTASHRKLDVSLSRWGIHLHLNKCIIC